MVRLDKRCEISSDNVILENDRKQESDVSEKQYHILNTSKRFRKIKKKAPVRDRNRHKGVFTSPGTKGIFNS